MSDILFEEEPFNGVDVKAASIDKLIQYCLEKFDDKHESKDTGAFVKVFFQTYHWYITTEELLQKFIDLCHKKDESSDAFILQVYKAVKYWIDHFGCDIEGNHDALSLLQTLNTKICDVNGFSQLLNLDEWKFTKRSTKVRLESERRESLNFNDMPAEEIAEQLLYLNWKSLKKIPPSEWIRYGKSGKTESTPLLKEQIGLFNDVSKYVMAMILNRLAAENRVNAIDKFVKISKKLLELKDFNTLLAVIGGLAHSTISRLYKTRELLSNENKLFIKETNELLSSDYNYGKYRAGADDTTGFMIPILGVVMKDLIAIDVSSKDYIEHQGEKLIHFHKMVQVATALEQVLRSRYVVPTVSPKKDVFNVMRVSLRSRYTEDDLYQMSLEREPRAGASRTPTVSEDPVFAEWAQGLSQGTPNRPTVEKYVNDMVEAVFKTYDLDQNGSISKDEFDALASNFPIIDNFAVLDINCDGSISRQEMVNYFMNANSQEMTKEFLHDFQEHTFFSPHYCVYCMGFLWGIGKQGYRCKVCQISCHKDCRNHVVMECRPNRTLSLRGGTLEKSGKSQRKRLKYFDQEWRGSTDSHLSYDNDGSPQIHRSDRSSVSVNGDVFNSPSMDFTDSYVSRLKEKISKLEQEKNALRRENASLKSKLNATENQVSSLHSQLGLVRQQSVKFMLEQVERLHTCKETDV